MTCDAGFWTLSRDNCCLWTSAKASGYWHSLSKLWKCSPPPNTLSSLEGPLIAWWCLLLSFSSSPRSQRITTLSSYNPSLGFCWPLLFSSSYVSKPTSPHIQCLSHLPGHHPNLPRLLQLTSFRSTTSPRRNPDDKLPVASHYPLQPVQNPCLCSKTAHLVCLWLGSRATAGTLSTALPAPGA